MGVIKEESTGGKGFDPLALEISFASFRLHSFWLFEIRTDMVLARLYESHDKKLRTR